MTTSITFTREEIELAGRMLKVIKLCSMPGMDEVAVKLNCDLTYDEEKVAARWAKAFELAKGGGKLFELANELNKAFR